MLSTRIVIYSRYACEENRARNRILNRKNHGKGFTGRETFTVSEIDKIIAYNKKKVQERGEGFEVDRDVLVGIIDRLANYDSVVDHRLRIVKKTAHLLAGIAFLQPFHEGNKETAFVTAMSFLHANGFTIPNIPIVRKEIYGMLVKTALKFGRDTSVYSEVEEFLAKRITSYRPL